VNYYFDIVFSLLKVILFSAYGYYSLAMYYRGAAAAILVYDITRASTFKTLQAWVEELKSKGPKEIAIAIAGNKADLEEQREVDRNVAAQYAADIGAIYLETSAKEDTNVQDIFIKLSGRLPAQQAMDSNVVRASTSNVRTNKQPANKSGCCT
jgi:Ras-related protein Rab-22